MSKLPTLLCTSSTSVFFAALCALLVADLHGQGVMWEWCSGQSGFIGDMTTDPGGNSYVVANIANGNDFLGTPIAELQPFIAKVATSGQAAWGQVMENTNIERLVEHNGKLFVVGIGYGEHQIGEGAFSADTSIGSTFFARLDTTGQIEWLVQVESTNNIQSADIAFGQNGAIYVAGSGYGPIWSGTDTLMHSGTSAKAFVWKISTDGEIQWLRTAGCDISAKTRAKGIACDGQDGIYVTGYTSADPMYCDSIPFGDIMIPIETTFFLAKLDGQGNFNWVVPGTAASGSDVELLNDMHILVSGGWAGTATMNGEPWVSAEAFNMFLASFDLEGALVWTSTSVGSTPTSAFYPVRLVAVGNGSVYCAAYTNAGGAFPGGNQVTQDSRSVTFKIDGDGTIGRYSELYLDPISAINTIETTGLGCDALGNTYTCGYFWPGPALSDQASVVWGGEPVASDGNGWSLFIAKTAPAQANGFFSASGCQYLDVGPNPCDEGFWIASKDDVARSYSLHATDGRIVAAGTLNDRKFPVATASLASGLYTLLLSHGEQIGVMKIVVQH